MSKWTIHATAASGLEAVVKRECEKLGLGPCRVEDGHVLFSGDATAIMRANLWLSVADRVLVECGRFEATSFDALFETVAAMPWADVLPANAAFPVQAKTVRSTLASPSDVQKITKKAIVRAMQRKYALEHFPEDGPRVPVDVTLRRDQAIVTVDTTGEGLFKRGYRQHKGGAPIKETLAAALIDLSVWTPERDFADVFCGSGTLVIEAARKAKHIAPGIDRTFLFQEWPWMDPTAFRDLRREAFGAIRTHVDGRFLGTDIDLRMVDIARKNAQDAGVDDVVRFVHRDMREVGLAESFGVLITNPPYGQRLAPEEGVATLMRDFARRFFALRTWSLYVITALRDFETLAGREATRRRKLFNGGEEATYYQFLGPDPRQFRA